MCNKSKFIFFLIAIVFAFSIFGVSQAKASGNVYGWAWTSNIGWISFNNLGLADIPGGGGSIDYGVNIESNGNLTGYAWSENIGWINFRPTIDSYSPTFPDGTTTNYAKVILTGNHLVSGPASRLHRSEDRTRRVHRIRIRPATTFHRAKRSVSLAPVDR